MEQGQLIVLENSSKAQGKGMGMEEEVESKTPAGVTKSGKWNNKLRRGGMRNEVSKGEGCNLRNQN